MSDLIINGIDHSVFDLEWAKRGGVVLTYLCGAKSIQNWTQFGIIGLDNEGIEAAQTHKLNDDSKFELLVDQLKFNGGSIRMATPAECAEAGIEYIEPPAVWRDIESAQKDKAVQLYSSCIKEYHPIAYYDLSSNCWRTGNDTVIYDPTHWMPLPQPPKDE